jgi:hypothetical protein
MDFMAALLPIGLLQTWHQKFASLAMAAELFGMMRNQSTQLDTPRSI